MIVAAGPRCTCGKRHDIFLPSFGNGEVCPRIFAIGSKIHVRARVLNPVARSFDSIRLALLVRRFSGAPCFGFIFATTSVNMSVFFPLSRLVHVLHQGLRIVNPCGSTAAYVV